MTLIGIESKNVKEIRVN